MFTSGLRRCLLFVLCAAMFAGCKEYQPPPMQLTVSFNGTELYKCPKTSLSKLGGGGIRFTCNADDASLKHLSAYVYYDSTELKDGSVKNISLMYFNKKNPPKGFISLAKRYFPKFPNVEPEFYAARYANKKGHPCASAKALKRKSGEKPFPKGKGGYPPPGTYAFSTSNPCGTLTFSLK